MIVPDGPDKKIYIQFEYVITSLKEYYDSINVAYQNTIETNFYTVLLKDLSELEDTPVEIFYPFRFVKAWCIFQKHFLSLQNPLLEKEMSQIITIQNILPYKDEYELFSDFSRSSVLLKFANSSDFKKIKDLNILFSKINSQESKTVERIILFFSLLRSKSEAKSGNLLGKKDKYIKILFDFMG